MSQPLDNDIKFLTGVGEARANLLRTELGIRTVGDLLRHYPYRYIDRTTSTASAKSATIRSPTSSSGRASPASSTREAARKNVSSPP